MGLRLDARTIMPWVGQRSNFQELSWHFGPQRTEKGPAFKIESLNRVSDGFEVLTVSVYLAATIPAYSPRLSLVWSLANIFAWDFAWSAAIFAAQSYGWNIETCLFCSGDLRHDGHSWGESQPWNPLRKHVSFFVRLRPDFRFATVSRTLGSTLWHSHCSCLPSGRGNRSRSK